MRQREHRSRKGQDGFATGLRAACLLIVIVMITAAALIVNSATLFSGWQEKKQSNLYNRAWSMSQLEADYANLHVSTKEGVKALQLAKPVDMARIRLAFDIFYSRVSVFSTLISTRLVEAETPLDLSALLALREELTSLVDGIDAPDLGRLIELDHVLQDSRYVIRDASILAHMRFTRVAEAERAGNARILFIYVATLTSLAVLMIVAAVLSFRVGHVLRGHVRTIQKSAETLEQIWDAASYAVVVTDKHGRLRRGNAAAVNLLGSKLERFINPDKDTDTLPEIEIRQYLTDPFSAQIGKEPYRSHVFAPDGSLTPVMISIVALSNNRSGLSFAFFFQDMTLEALAEMELRRARDAAEAHAAAKDRFFASVSHEMRTPLHGLLGALDLLEKDCEGPDSVEIYSIAHSSAQNLLARVEDMLDIVRADDTDISGSDDVFCPSRIASRVLLELEDRAAQQHNALDLDITGEDSPKLYRGSARTFSRILEKLVVNGVNASQRGRVTVALGFDETPGDHDVRLTVEVIDNGAGISAEDKRRVFGPFEKGNKPELATSVGAGLGLTVAHALTRMMGGTIELDSSPGVGSRFFFSLDLTAVSVDEALPGSDQHTGRVIWGGDALVVDDNMVNVMLMRQMVERGGFRVEVAMSGQEAVHRASTKSFDLIVVDYLMAGMNGLEAARHIRQETVSDNAVILCVTAVPELIPEQEFDEMWADAILSKPLGVAGLTAALEAFDREKLPKPVETVLESLEDVQDDFDFDDLRAMLGQSTAEALLSEGMRDAYRAMSALRDADADLSKRIEAVHQAVASASMIGFLRLGLIMKLAQKHLMHENPPDIQYLLDLADTHIEAAEMTIVKISDRLSDGASGALIDDGPQPLPTRLN